MDGIVSVQGRFRYLFVNLVKHSFKLTVTRFWSCPGFRYEALTASSEATASQAGVRGRRPLDLDPHPLPPLPPHLGPSSRTMTVPGPECVALFSWACLGDPGSCRRDLVLRPSGPLGCGSGGRKGNQAAVCGAPSLKVANQDRAAAGRRLWTSLTPRANGNTAPWAKFRFLGRPSPSPSPHSLNADEASQKGNPQPHGRRPQTTCWGHGHIGLLKMNTHQSAQPAGGASPSGEAVGAACWVMGPLPGTQALEGLTRTPAGKLQNRNESHSPVQAANAG